ncbi:DNA polymerase III subunit epsilon [Caulobacter rhizosphaerae]|uniref:3'-5' exonuclease n=1 Tax=Caulobacter rhizosphaerae TaxID=2010972 RepID=UPI0019B1CB7B|nr:3'-5' exonuclease [Caulobacter rhizosphaerae]GGL35914.1 DNA polymerase III subunit epsilon [Caulobacter rhizosphaerae]
MTDTADIKALDAMAAQLEASGRYRLQRRFETNSLHTDFDPTTLKRGIYLDTETTGVDGRRDEVIELAMIPFDYDPQGRLCAVGQPFVALNQPKTPIPAEITRITGITDAMVAGHAIDPAQVAAFIASAVIIIAHNAAFDRPFAERLTEAFKFKGWACSMSHVDWKGHGFEGTKLSYLAGQCGFFFDGHRAENDCLAGLEILARPLPTGRTALAHLLETARAPTWRIVAERAPFEQKDRLKARGYRWNGDDAAGPKAWYTDVAEADRKAELLYLAQEIYGYDPGLTPKRITAFERFSDRA